MLTTRKKGDFIYVRGTVRVGKQIIKVPEQSTGFSKAKDAAEYISKLEADIRDEILNPCANRNNKVTFDDCLENYISKKRLKIGELQKINILIPFFEGKKVSEIKDGWNDFCIKKREIKINTLNRYLSTLKAILNLAKNDLSIEPPILKMQKINDKIVFSLDSDIREKLLSCYSPHAYPIFKILSLQGFRVQELLQLKWTDVNLKEKYIIIRKSKNGETRTVPMHNKTWWILSRMYIAQKKPTTEHVIKNSRGKSYTDTRLTGGGCPIRKAHITALARLKKEYGITLKMRVHDWRHDWASRMVMAQVDLLTLQKIGGWEDIKMVERYATFTNRHKQEAINKI